MSVKSSSRDAAIVEGGKRIQGDKIVWTYRIAYFIETDDPLDGPATVMEEAQTADPDPAPEIGDLYFVGNDSQAGAACVDVDPRQDPDSPRIWRLVCTYSTDPLLQQIAIDGNPLHKPTVINISTVPRKQVQEHDHFVNETGFEIPQAYANSAGEKFDPPEEDDEYDAVITFTKNVLNYDYEPEDTVNHTNEDTFQGNPPNTCLVIRYEQTPEEDNGVAYYRQVISIQVRKGGWIRKKLNQGSYSINPVTLIKQKNMDGNGNALSTPVFLDADGYQLPDTSSAEPVTSGEAATVTPGSMFNIKAGDTLVIDGGNVLLAEEVIVNSITATTFDAAFANDHPAKFQIQGKPTYQTFYPKRRISFAALDPA